MVQFHHASCNRDSFTLNMPLFGSHSAYMGVDIGTSTSKIVELMDRRRRIELVTYAESNLQNLLVNAPNGNQDAIDRTAQALREMMERAGTVSESAVAALPGGAVFSTVLSLPHIPEDEMEDAVRFAARDVIPADIDEMVLGWSTVGSRAHMTTDIAPAPVLEVKKPEGETKEVAAAEEGPIPVFITAAPKDVVERYIAVFEKLQIALLSLEVETFSLARALLQPTEKATLLIDFGSRATTFHIIEGGIPRVSHTIDFGGYDITKNLAKALTISEKEAEAMKNNFGISEKQEQSARTHIESLVKRQSDKAKDLVKLFEQKESKKISKSILIGGGANLLGLSEYWAKEFVMETAIGNPWKGLAYPASIEGALKKIAPRFGVAAGLALRSFTHVP